EGVQEFYAHKSVRRKEWQCQKIPSSRLASRKRASGWPTCPETLPTPPQHEARSLRSDLGACFVSHCACSSKCSSVRAQSDPPCVKKRTAALATRRSKRRLIILAD